MLRVYGELVTAPSHPPRNQSLLTIVPLLAHISRRTTSGRYLPEVDGLRFAAILLVVLFHLNGFATAFDPQRYSRATNGLLSAIATTGHNGVQIFFSISGFVLALPFAVAAAARIPMPSLKQYYMRRVTRLEPPYVVVMVVMALLLTATHRMPPSDAGSHLAASLLYQHNWLYGMPSTINVVAWSLEIEIQFYLIAPALATIFLIRSTVVRRAVLTTLIIGAIACQLAWGQGIEGLSILSFVQFFLVGFLLADIFVFEWNMAPTTSMPWDGVTLVGWPLMFWYWNRNDHHLPYFAIGMLPLLLGVFKGPVTRRIMSKPWLAAIGGACYSIYLIHFQVISAVGRLTTHVGAYLPFSAYLVTQALLLIPVVLAASALLFITIERPCMNARWPEDVRSRWRMMLSGAVRNEGELALREVSKKRVVLPTDTRIT